MGKSFRFKAITLALIIGFTGSLAFGQAAQVQKLLDKGKEQLRNNSTADAIESFRGALSTATTGASPLPDTSKLVGKVRYGLAYSLVANGQILEALPILDELVASVPEDINARYLLGVALVKTAVSANMARGAEVLGQMARENQGGIARIASGAAVRLAINYSTPEYASGNASSAANITKAVVAISESPAASEEENNHLRFAAGTYMVASGDAEGGKAQLKALLASNENYAIQSGVTGKQALEGALYKAAVASLGQGAEGADKALEILGEMDSFGGLKTAEAHHAKALALNHKGDKAGVQLELEAIQRINPAYLGKITK